jgi:hypothetical protein
MNPRDSITRRSFLRRLGAGGAMAAAAPYILPSPPGFRALPAGAAEANSLDVRRFGAKGDGVSNDTPAINRAIAEGVRLGPGATVLIPKGRYRLEHASGCHVSINDARGLTVLGEAGSVLVAADPNDHIVRLSKCTGTTLKGLTLEQEKTYFTQGTVDAMAPDGKSCDLTLENGAFLIHATCPAEVELHELPSSQPIPGGSGPQEWLKSTKRHCRRWVLVSC